MEQGVGVGGNYPSGIPTMALSMTSKVANLGNPIMLVIPKVYPANASQWSFSAKNDLGAVLCTSTDECSKKVGDHALFGLHPTPPHSPVPSDLTPDPVWSSHSQPVRWPQQGLSDGPLMFSVCRGTDWRPVI